MLRRRGLTIALGCRIICSCRLISHGLSRAKEQGQPSETGAGQVFALEDDQGSPLFGGGTSHIPATFSWPTGETSWWWTSWLATFGKPLGGRALGAGIEFGPGSPVGTDTEDPGVWLAAEVGSFDLWFILACRLTRRLLNRGSWLLFLQLSTAL
jgi:hypothetical protein